MSTQPFSPFAYRTRNQVQAIGWPSLSMSLPRFRSPDLKHPGQKNSVYSSMSYQDVCSLASAWAMSCPQVAHLANFLMTFTCPQRHVRRMSGLNPADFVRSGR